MPWPSTHSSSGASSERLDVGAVVFPTVTTTRFARMFPLAAWAPSGATRDAQLEHLAQLSASIGEAHTENPEMPAGYTYLGQLVAHDLSHDASRPAVDLGFDEARNLRTARLDLDCVYGAGPADQPYLFRLPSRPGIPPEAFLLGRNANFELDLPRNGDDGTDDATSCALLNRRRVALIGDPRDDENLLVAQLHLQFLRLHNRWVEEGRSFEEARRLTTWHYQWVVVRDFLVRLCGREAVERRIAAGIQASSPWFQRCAGRLPVEFVLGVFRVGHSMIRSHYHLSDALERDREGLPVAVFSLDPPHGLQGGRELPPNWTIQWDRFVDWKGKRAQRSMAIDASLAAPLRALPNPWPGDHRLGSLAFRTLLRGWAYGLPSGQAVARAMGLDPVRDGNDPLWLYVLLEAEARSDHRVGPVATTIIADVLLGALREDPRSFLNADPAWTPLPELGGIGCGLAELLAFAGAPMTEDDWYAQRTHADVARAEHLQRLQFRDHANCLKPAKPRP